MTKRNLIVRRAIPAPTVKELQAGDELLRRVRAALILSGSSLNGYCRENGIDPAHARQALQGKSNGSAARGLRSRIAADAGLVMEA